MKRFAWTAFVAFWAATLTILVIGALTPETPTPQPREDGLPLITLEELALHNTGDDCWMAIRGKVYDFTEYIPEHPTPPEVMTDWCGREATEPYDTKGYGFPHSPFADELMEQYLIGILDDGANAQP